MSKTKKMSKAKPRPRPAMVPIGDGRRCFLYNAETIDAARDVDGVIAAHHDPSTTLETYTHRPIGGRVVAELEHLLTHADILSSPIRDRAKSHVALLKGMYTLPRAYSFYPRDHVPPGGTPYDEEYVRVENFGVTSLGSGISETRGSGFASFNPGTGVFTTVGYAFGSTADVRSGPIVTMETHQHKVDIWLTANFLLDYQYMLSASVNPGFQAPVSAAEQISVKIDLLLDIDIRNLNGDQLSRASAMKPLKYAAVQPGSTLPPYIAGTQEIVPGNYLQGGVLAVPVAWDYTFAAPANAVVRVGVIAAPFVTATGARTSKDYRHIGNADGRAYGQVTSVHAMLFRD